MRLSTRDHDRDNAGLRYVYPVVSRRARGVSIGINLNPNNACNWRCVYCQVPGLVAGKGPRIDLGLLERELTDFLVDVVHGDWMQEFVPEGSRRLNDLAFSGNGEPTGSPDFGAAVDVALAAMQEFELVPEAKPIVITNGSLARDPAVLEAFGRMSELGGNVWFKLDRATRAGLDEVNSVKLDPERHLENLRRTARACPTWVQTCMFARDGVPPSEEELSAYLDALARLVEEGTPLEGVLLYGLERPSYQPEAPRLSALPPEWLEELGRRIEAVGLVARVHP